MPKPIPTTIEDWEVFNHESLMDAEALTRADGGE